MRAKQPVGLNDRCAGRLLTVAVGALALGAVAGAPTGCSPDTSGLANIDGGAMGGRGGTGARATGGRPGSGGVAGPGAGGMAGRASGGAGPSNGSGGAGGGGRSGSGGIGGGAGANASGTGGIGTGGMASGGRGGTGAIGGTGAAGAPGSGGAIGGAGGHETAGSGGVGTGGLGGGDAGGTAGAASGGNGGSAGNGGRGGEAGGNGNGGGGMSASGGQGGGGGTASGGAAGGPGPECRTAVDCRLENDCCQCAAVPDSTPPSICMRECIQSVCSAMQLPPNELACVAGRCVAGFNCDASRVVCLMAKPICVNGLVPAVNAAGTCYTGGCVAATQCTRVTSCADCGGPQSCVIYQMPGGNQFHCVTAPPACQSDFTCGCLGPTVCTGTHRTCGNLSGQRGVTCS